MLKYSQSDFGRFYWRGSIFALTNPQLVEVSPKKQTKRKRLIYCYRNPKSTSVTSTSKNIQDLTQLGGGQPVAALPLVSTAVGTQTGEHAAEFGLLRTMAPIQNTFRHTRLCLCLGIFSHSSPRPEELRHRTVSSQPGGRWQNLVNYCESGPPGDICISCVPFTHKAKKQDAKLNS